MARLKDKEGWSARSRTRSTPRCSGPPPAEVVANVAVGYNNIDVAAAHRRGIVVTNTPDVLTDTTADFAWVLLMATARRVVEADGYVRAGKWHRWEFLRLLGGDVHGKTSGSSASADPGARRPAGPRIRHARSLLRHRPRCAATEASSARRSSIRPYSSASPTS